MLNFFFNNPILFVTLFKSSEPRGLVHGIFCFVTFVFCFFRWILSVKSDLKITEPEFFQGDELEIVDSKPNLVRRTLKMMEITEKEDQDFILKRITQLVNGNVNSKIEPQQQNENENDKDVWK